MYQYACRGGMAAAEDAKDSFREDNSAVTGPGNDPTEGGGFLFPGKSG